MAGKPRLHGWKDKLILEEDRQRVLSHIIMHADDHYVREGGLAIHLADKAGLRAEEIANLRGDHCDISRAPYRLLIWGGKKRAKDHVDEVPVDSELVEIIRPRIESLRDPKDYVVGSRRTAYDRRYIYKLVKDIHRACELPSVLAVHSWRHTFITRCYQATKDLVWTSKMARHKNIQITMNYVHAAELLDEQEDNFAAMRALSAGKRTTTAHRTPDRNAQAFALQPRGGGKPSKKKAPKKVAKKTKTKKKGKRS